MEKPKYQFISSIGSPCASHKDIPIEHLFGNTNWTMKKDGKTITFICQQCGEVRTYLEIAEKTLL